jgi:hypothetical protein
MEGNNGDWEEDGVNDVECVGGEQGDKEGGVKMFTGEVVDEEVKEGGEEDMKLDSDPLEKRIFGEDDVDDPEEEGESGKPYSFN